MNYFNCFKCPFCGKKGKRTDFLYDSYTKKLHCPDDKTIATQYPLPIPGTTDNLKEEIKLTFLKEWD